MKFTEVTGRTFQYVCVDIRKHRHIKAGTVVYWEDVSKWLVTPVPSSDGLRSAAGLWIVNCDASDYDENKYPFRYSFIALSFGGTFHCLTV